MHTSGSAHLCAPSEAPLGPCVTASPSRVAPSSGGSSHRVDSGHAAPQSIANQPHTLFISHCTSGPVPQGPPSGPGELHLHVFAECIASSALLDSTKGPHSHSAALVLHRPNASAAVLVSRYAMQPPASRTCLNTSTNTTDTASAMLTTHL